MNRLRYHVTVKKERGGCDGIKCIDALRKTVLLSKNDCHFVGESV